MAGLGPAIFISPLRAQQLRKNAMTYYSTLRGYRFSGDQSCDIRGATVHATTDEKLGQIDDVLFESSTGEIRYVAIDIGFLLSSRRFIVPADRLHESIKHEGDFVVDMSKAQIEALPPFEPRAVESDEDWSAYETRYESRWPSTTTGRVGERGRRWTAFEHRLRADRLRILSYSPDGQRKAG